jgi:hypothetical protein
VVDGVARAIGAGVVLATLTDEVAAAFTVGTA